MARRLDAQAEIAFSLNLLGNVIEVQGEREEAVLLYEESLRISRKLDDQRAMAGSLHNLGGAAINRGDFMHAKSCFGKSLARYQGLESQTGIAHVLDSLGKTNYLLGDYEEAEACFNESLERFAELDDRRGKAKALSGLATVALARGGPDLAQAHALASESLAIDRTIGHRLEVARQLILLGEVALAESSVQQAEKHFREGLTTAQHIGFSAGTPTALDGLAQVSLQRGEFGAAATHCRAALELAIENHNVPALLNTLVTCATWLVKHVEGWHEGGMGTEGAAALHQAKTILLAVRHHPAAWATIQDRASAQLTTLPANIEPLEPTKASISPLSVEELAVELLLEVFVE
jgi:tetratricopeptide (TPR) repeat protein